MAQRKVRRVPIVDAQGRVTGIIAQADVATRVRRDSETGQLVESISEPAVSAEPVADRQSRWSRWPLSEPVPTPLMAGHRDDRLSHGRGSAARPADFSGGRCRGLAVISSCSPCGQGWLPLRLPARLDAGDGNHDSHRSAARACRRGLPGRARDVRGLSAVFRVSRRRSHQWHRGDRQDHRADARHHPDGPGAAAHGRLGSHAAPQARRADPSTFPSSR